VADDGGVLYLVVSGAPAPEGIPALVAACQAAGWQVVVFSTPTGTRFIDPAALERLTGEPVRSEYRMPGTGASVPAADAGSLDTLRGMSVRVLFDPDEPYERRLPPWHEVIDALPVRAGAG
jgi:hypothetical protein